MSKFRSYAVLVSIAASAGLLAACGNDEADNGVDTDAVTEAPVTQTPPATAPEPAVTETPTATTPPAASDASPAPTSSTDSSDVNPDPLEEQTDTGSVNGSSASGSSSDALDDPETLSESGSGDDSATDITPEPDAQ